MALGGCLQTLGNLPTRVDTGRGALGVHLCRHYSGADSDLFNPVQATAGDLHVIRQILDRHGLQASDVSLHTAITANTVDTAPFQQAFGRDLDRAQILGAGMMRISIKTEADVVWAQRAADQARERGIRLVQQTHTYSFKSLRGKRWPANELSTAAHSGRALN